MQQHGMAIAICLIVDTMQAAVCAKGTERAPRNTASSTVHADVVPSTHDSPNDVMNSTNSSCCVRTHALGGHGRGTRAFVYKKVEEAGVQSVSQCSKNSVRAKMRGYT